MAENEPDERFDDAGTLAARLRDPGVTIQFSGQLYAWMEELARDLRDASSPAEVAKLGGELLHLAHGKEVVLRDKDSEQTVDLWSRARS